jgi:hypothetical protein
MPRRKRINPDSYNFDLFKVIEVREKAIKKADVHANDEWKDAMANVVYYVATIMREFTSDDVRQETAKRMKADPDFPVTHNLSALGPVMRRAEADGWIVGTTNFIPSRVVTRHSAPIKIWRSLIYKGYVALNQAPSE